MLFRSICGYESLQGTMCVEESGETLTSGLVGVIKDGALTYMSQ